MKSKILLSVIITVLFFSCSTPSSQNSDVSNTNESKYSSITVSFSASTSNRDLRTVVTDFSTLTWKVVLTRSGFADITTNVTINTASPTQTVTINNIVQGTWSVTVTALNSNSQIVAEGTVDNVSISASTATCDVPITFKQTSLTGKGGYSLKVIFPKTVDSIVVTKITTQLDSEPTKDFTSFTSNGSNYQLTLSENDISSGTHTLSITFYAGTDSLGTFTEAINIWDNTISDKWINPADGKLIDSRTFSEIDFSKTNSSLANISLVNTILTFNSATTTYENLNVTNTYIRFTATQSIAGQKISYNWDGAGLIDISSGQLSQSLNMPNETVYTLLIKVTAPNGTATTTYTITLARGYVITFEGNGTTISGSVSDMVIKSGQTFTFPANGFTNTTDGFTHTFVGWNTSATATTGTATGTSPVITSNTTYYAIWTSIGCTGPAGGLVFYDKREYTDGWRYLETAPIANEASKQWDSGGYGTTGATDTSIGKGKINTFRINLTRGTEGVAANYCSTLSYTPSSFNDWFLPSKDELNLMYNNLKLNGFGDFANSAYWSSSEYSLSGAVDTVFSDGSNLTPTKNNFFNVRPIRAFRSEKPTYIVLYDANVATGGTAPNDGFYYQSGETVTVLGNTGTLFKTDLNFIGWNLASDGSGTNYQAGETITIGSSNVVLYAKWGAAIPISDAATLAKIGNDVNYPLTGSYTLTSDITLSGNWTPIASSSVGFTGTFDGNGKTISGLTISGSSLTIQGLFGRVGSQGKIKNLAVSGANINVTNGGHVGVIAGINSGGTIENCYAINGTINTTGGDGIGGIVGTTENSGILRKCFSSIEVAAGSQTGGLVGNHWAGQIINCYATGKISGTEKVGGLVGYNNSLGSITNSYSTGIVSGTNNFGGLVGNNNSGTITACYYDTNTSGQSDTGKGDFLITTNMKFQISFSGWDFTNVWNIGSGNNMGYPYLIDNYPTGFYTVTYDGNEATGGIPPYDNVFYKNGDSITIKSNTGNLVKTGYSLAGWTNDNTGTGTLYSYGGTNPTMSAGTSNITLFAKWIANKNITVNFNTKPNYSYLVFTPASAVVAKNGFVSISTNTEFSSLTGWSWYVNGVKDDTKTESTFIFTAGTTAGENLITCSVKLGKILYSGSLKITVKE